MKPKRSNPLFARYFAAGITSFILCTASGQAASYQWDTNGSAPGLGGSGSWDTTNTFWDLVGTGVDDGTDATVAVANWNPTTAVDSATFGGTAGTVTLASAVNALGTNFSTSGYIFNLTNTAATTYKLGALAGNATINVTLGTGTTTADFGATDLSGFTGTLNVGVAQAAGAGKAAASAAFGNGFASAATVNLTANSSLYSSTFTTHAAALTLNGGDTGEALGQLRLDNGGTWKGAITLASAMIGTDSFIGTNTATSFITGAIGETGGAKILSKGGGGTTVLSGANTYSGGTILRSGTLAVTAIGNVAATSGPLGAGGTFDIAANGTLSYWGVGETTDRLVNYSTGNGGVISNDGAGALTFSTNLTAANIAMGLTFTGGADISIPSITGNAATLNFNKTGQGTLTVNGDVTSTTTASNIRPQGGVLSFASSATTTTNSTIISQRSGGGILRVASGASIKTAADTNTNGIMGGWATFNNTDWAQVNGAGTAITAYSGYTSDTWASGNNTDVTTSGAPVAASTTNSLRFNTAAANTLTLSGTNIISSGGILLTSAVGANATAISGGTLLITNLTKSGGTTGANAGDMILHQNNTAAALTISSIIASAVPAARTGDFATGQKVITGLSSTTDLVVGMTVTGTGIAASSTIASINSATQITLNNNTTAVGTAVSLTFGAATNTLTVAGPGTSILTGANSYTGTTYVIGGAKLTVNANNGGKFYQLAANSTLELGYSPGTALYGYGVSVYGAGTAATTGLYLKGGNNYNLQSTLAFKGAPSTVRGYGTGNANLYGFDTNGTHLSVDSSASGSIIDNRVDIQSSSFGYVMNIAPGLNTATGDLIIQGIVKGTPHIIKKGDGSVKCTGAGTNTAAFEVWAGSAILSGGANRLGAGSSMILGQTTVSGKLVLDGVSQTFTSLTTSGTGTANSVVGGNATLSTLTINNATASTLASKIGGKGTNENNIALAKSGAGTLSLTAANTHTGGTTVNAGTLQLDYSTIDGSKLADSSVLSLSGGTLDLAGGTHNEIIGSTVLSGTGVASITRSSGAAVISLGNITRASTGSLNIAADNIAKTTLTNDVSGRLPFWITVNGLPASNDGSGNIITYVPSFADVNRLGGQITSNPASDVRIVDGGVSGDITPLTSGLTDIASLLQTATAGPAIVTLGASDTLRFGAAGTLVVPSGSGNLTLQNGAITAGGVTDTAGSIAIGNDVDLTLASTINDNGIGLVSLSKIGTGALTLSASNAFTGGLTLGNGVLQINHFQGMGFDGTFTINGGAIDNTSGSAIGILDNIPQVWNSDFSFVGSNNLSFNVGNVTLGGNRTVTVNGGTLGIGGNINGAFTLAKAGAGTLTVGGGNWSGVTTVSGGTLEVMSKTNDVNYVLASGATLRIGYTTATGYTNTNLKLTGDGTSATTGLYLSGGRTYNTSGGIELLAAPTTIRQYGSGLASIGIHDINGNGITGSAASSGSVIDANIQMVNIGFGMSVNIPSGANTATGDLVINGRLNVGSLGFYKRGNGSVLLNAAATTTNVAVQIQGGTVITGIANALGANANLPISAGAKLVMNGYSQAAGTLSGAGAAVNGSVTATTLTIKQAADATFSGVLGGVGTNESNLALVKTGTSKLTLTGANTYSGDTTVTAGTLSLGQVNPNNESSTVSIASGATLDLAYGGIDTVDKLFINNVQQPAGDYTSGGVFTGGGTLHVTSGPAGYDAWSAQITNGKTLRTQDADDDGFTNLQEFLFGTDPMASTGTLVTMTSSGGTLVLRWLQRETGSTYTLKESSTLSGWTTVVSPVPALDGDQTGVPTDYDFYKVTLTIGAGKDFYRIEGVEN